MTPASEAVGVPDEILRSLSSPIEPSPAFDLVVREPKHKIAGSVEGSDPVHCH